MKNGMSGFMPTINDSHLYMSESKPQRMVIDPQKEHIAVSAVYYARFIQTCARRKETKYSTVS